MNQFDKTAIALQTAMEELEKIPESLRSKFFMVGELLPLMRQECLRKHDLGKAAKEVE